jgi:hypothetical protein
MTFTPVPGTRYDMPVAFGPSVAPAVSTGFETFNASLIYRSEKDAVAALLPRWFEPTDEQTVTIGYTRMVNMDWMGGRNYNIVSIGASVVCTASEEDRVGRYTLAIWESDAAPVLAGREYMGSPKLHATIPDVDISAPEFTFSCHEYDALLVEGSLHGMRELTAEELAPFTKAGSNSVGFNWKYVPGLGDEPDVDYPTALYMSTPYDRGWRGQGSVHFGTPTDQEAPYSARITRVLAKLPLLELKDAVALHSSGSSLFRDRTHRLDRPTPKGR